MAPLEWLDMHMSWGMQREARIRSAAEPTLPPTYCCIDTTEGMDQERYVPVFDKAPSVDLIASTAKQMRSIPEIKSLEGRIMMLPISYGRIPCLVVANGIVTYPRATTDLSAGRLLFS